MAARKILLIDCDAASRKFIASALAQHGYDVLLAASGTEGLQATSREAPDLILVDPTLQDVPGDQLAFKIRSDPRTSTLPLVALSSDAQPARMKSCMLAGFSEYLVKSPNVMPTLIDRLAQLLPGETPAVATGCPLITFLSAKGGAGTSTMCANIAMNMADSRPTARVAVVDLVLPIGSIAGIVDYRGAMNMVTLAESPAADLTPDFLRGGLPRLDRWGFHLLAGSPDPQRGSELNGERASSIVAALQQAFDFVVIDLGRSLSRISFPLIDRADLVVMIVGTDPMAAELSGAVWKYLLGKGVQASGVYVIMNRAVGHEGLKKDEAEEVVGLPFNAAIPHQAENFSLANNHHQPYCDRFPADATSIIIKQAALEIMDLAGQNRTR